MFVTSSDGPNSNSLHIQQPNRKILFTNLKRDFLGKNLIDFDPESSKKYIE